MVFVGFTHVTSLPEVITRHYSPILCCFVVTEQCTFGIGTHSLFG